jgi:SAM-dependent methyltransferase
MLELTEWIAGSRFPDRPWLMVGKGPTFDRRGEFDLAAYNVVGLNHVIDRIDVDVAHIIDVNVVADCAARLRDGAEWLLMPRIPHVHSRHGTRMLEDWFDELPVLRELDERGRLVWYNAITGTPVAGSPVIDVGNFSSEAVLRILGRMGVRTVRSLGIDGGRTYAGAFRELEASTLLENGAAGYDVQFAVLERICAEYDIDYRPLVEPLRIFVGTDTSQIVAYRVLEYSIRKAASIPVEVTPMFGVDMPVPRDAANRSRTGFSFSRFKIPELCGYRGRGVYMDADMLVFGDVAELASLEFGDQTVLLTDPQHPASMWDEHVNTYIGPAKAAVMVLDCDRLDWKVDDVVAGLDAGRYTYAELMTDICVVPPEQVEARVPPEWNDLEHYDPETTRLIHFTVVPVQPWKNDDNPLTDLWMAWYQEAVAAGAVPPGEVEELIRTGSVKPGLRPALRDAPARQTFMTGASLDLVTAKERVAELERRLDAMERSTSWRVGQAVTRMAQAPARLVRRGSGADAVGGGEPAEAAPVHVAVETLAGCPVCGAADQRPWSVCHDRLHGLDDQDFLYVRCGDCGLRYLAVRPTEQDASRLYPTDDASYLLSASVADPESAAAAPPADAPPSAAARASRKARTLVDRALPDRLPTLLAEVYTPRQPGVLVDYGCGGPAFLDQARADGWTTTIGVDMNPEVVASVVAAGHRGVVVSEVETAIDDGSVAVFRLNHVFEHLYDPVDVLARLRRKLAAGGVVHLAVPNGDSVWAAVFREDWCNSDPRHIVQYGPAQLRRVAAEAGFTQVEVVHEVITRGIALSWGYRRERRGSLSHDGVAALADDRRLGAVLALPARISASLGRGDRFHAVLRADD